MAHLAQSPYKVVVGKHTKLRPYLNFSEDEEGDVTKLLPLRLHMNKVITHATCPRSITFEELQTIIHHSLDLKV